MVQVEPMGQGVIYGGLLQECLSGMAMERELMHEQESLSSKVEPAWVVPKKPQLQ